MDEERNYTDAEIEEILDSEYADEALEGVGEENLLGYARRNPKRFSRRIKRNSRRGKRKVTVQVNGSASSMSRGEFKSRFGLLSKDVQRALTTGKKQIVDTELFVTKSVSGQTTLRALQDDDKKLDGVSNMSGGKIEKGEVFLLSAIQLLSGVGSGTAETAAVAGIVEYGIIEKNLRNGTFEIRGNGKTLVPPHGTQVFATQIAKVKTFDNTGDLSATTGIVGGASTIVGENSRPGLMKLANPKMIESQVQIDFNLIWGVAPATNTFVKLSLIGSRVINY